MYRWAPLFSKIVDSSVWKEPDYICKVWITLLALQDADHIVRMGAYEIADRAKKTEKEVLDALKVLSSPDKRRLEPQPNQGRRIEKVEDGWLILNGDFYEKLMRKIARQAYQAKWAREHRAKASVETVPGSKSEVGQKDVESAVENGKPLRDERIGF